MKTKVKFKVVDYNTGKTKTKILDIEHPEFKDYDFEFQGYNLVKRKEAQIDDYILDLDKTELMMKYDWGLIIDWEILEKKEKSISKPKQVFEMLNHYVDNQQIKDDFEAVYNKIYETIKNLSVLNQYNVVMSSVSTSYIAANEAYKNISNILKKPLRLKNGNILNYDE